MTYLPFILLVLLSLISSVYLAAQKNFLFTPNQKQNSFAIRLFFLIPGTAGMILGGCFLIWAIFIVFFENFSYSVYGIFGYYSLLPLPLLGSLFLILFSKKYILRNEMPPEFQSSFLDYDLYVYMPSIREIDDRPSVKDLSLNFERNFEIPVLTLGRKKLSDENILFTKKGEIIVTNFASSVLDKNNLTGCQYQSVPEKKTMLPSNDYLHLISSPISSVSSLTEIKKTTFPWKGVLVKDDQVYYNSSILKEVSDFNRSFEHFGSDNGHPFYYPQRLWIVTNKAMKVLVNELNQPKRDFIPVHLVDDEKL